MKQYVLCNRHPEIGAVTFVCGPGPSGTTFHPTPELAAKFEAPEDAMNYRTLMGLEGASKYRVYELLPNGQLIDVET